jgi:ABC-type branched-subunit amino acid transport system substrate-binding protein
MLALAPPRPSILASFRRAGRRVCAIAGAVAIAALAGCTTAKEAKITAPPPPKAPAAAHPMTGEEQGFLRLPDMAPSATPVRVGIILPFTNGSPATRKLAQSMMNAAEMALFDSGNRNILLIGADEGGGDGEAANAAIRLLSQGAEVILGPLFSHSVAAVAPIARERGVPVIAFSSDRSVAGNGVYLLSYQPENEIQRIVSYAAAQGHSNFAALVPRNGYGDHVAAAFRADVPAASGQIADLERFDPSTGDVVAPAQSISASAPDALLVAQGGQLLRNIAPTLAYDGLDSAHVKLLGTGVWDDPSILHEPALVGGWFAAPQPDADDSFDARYQSVFAAAPAPLTTLAYDAVSLVALLSSGPAYHRFTPKALTNPNGFSGITGIFRFNANGACERGLAILGVGQDGFTVVSPAPKTFEHIGS